MSAAPAQITLELEPRARFDVIDVTRRLGAELEDFRRTYRRALYCSYHTTAGYLEQGLCARLENSPDRLDSFIRLFRHLFPPHADYRHDRLDLRTELSEEQRRREPKNADSHLAFIGSGLRNCVTYANRPETPVYFIDLDGVHEHGRRKRQTTVLGFQREETIESTTVTVPVSGHPIDSVSLKDPRLAIYEQLDELVRRHGIDKGRIDISLDPAERHAGLTVNEFETLLMTHDLADVLGNPLWFMAQKGRNMLRDPRAIPYKTLDYARYDLVQVLNQAMDALGISESIVERMVARFMAVPAARFLRMKRSVSLLVTDRRGDGRGTIVQGTYQSPILVQWRKAERQARRLAVQLVRFD